MAVASPVITATLLHVTLSWCALSVGKSVLQSASELLGARYLPAARLRAGIEIEVNAQLVKQPSLDLSGRRRAPHRALVLGLDASGKRSRGGLAGCVVFARCSV